MMHLSFSWLGPVAHALGWSLIHFVWQGALVALGLVCMLALMRRRSANARYLASCAALLLMAALFVGTMGQLLSVEPGVEPPGPTVSAHAALPGSTGVLIAERSVVVPSGSTARSWAVRLDEWRVWVEPLTPHAALLWGIGLSMLALWNLGCWFYARRLMTRDVLPVSQARLDEAAAICARLGVTRPVRLLESARVAAPMVAGIVWPVILLPASVLTGLDAPLLRALIAHEVAHIWRHDYAVNLVQTAIVTLLFYHPAVWWVSRRIREERENCCDDLAVGTCGNAVLYARALAALAELRHAPAFALSANGGVLLRRIRRIVGRPEPRAHGWAAMGPGVMVLLALLASAALALILPAESARAQAAESATGETANAIEEALARPVTLEFEDIHLLDLLKSIAESQHVNLALDWRVIKPTESILKQAPGLDRQIGYATDGRVPYFKVSNIPLRQALESISRPLGLAFVVEPHAIWISTPERIAADAQRSRPNIEDPALKAALDSPVSLIFEAIPVVEVLAFLGESYDLDISIDQRALDASGGAAILPYLSVLDLPVIEALDTMLRMLDLTFAAKEGGIWVSSEAHIAEAGGPDAATFWRPVEKVAVNRNEPASVKTVLPRDLQLLRVEEAEGAKRAQIQTGSASNWYREGDRFEDYEVVKIDIQQKAASIRLIKEGGQASDAISIELHATPQLEPLPNVIPVELFETGWSAFRPGDSITVTELRGSTDRIEPGQTYQVKGHYVLASEDRALLALYCTDGEVKEARGTKSAIVNKGEGDFAWEFTIVKPGMLHVSFYPAEGGDGFGGCYFRQPGVDNSPAMELRGSSAHVEPGQAHQFEGDYVHSDGSARTVVYAADGGEVKKTVLLSGKGNDGPSILSLSSSWPGDPGQGGPQPETGEKPDVSTKQGMMALVEDFFQHNYRDITARESIEWGEVEKGADGNQSIRYMCRATIGYKEVLIINDIYTFDPQGVFVKVEKVPGYPKPEAGTPGSAVSPEKAELMGLVEDFFLNNYRDITARKSLEWGEAEQGVDGNRSIRYMCRATIWDKDVLIMNEVYTFNSEGAFVKVEKVPGYPKPEAEKKRDISTKQGMMDLVEDFFANNYRDITARETIEWGEVVKLDNGNASIRYKYNATIWDKEKKVIDQVFTFNPDGEYVSVEDADA